MRIVISLQERNAGSNPAPTFGEPFWSDYPFGFMGSNPIILGNKSAAIWRSKPADAFVHRNCTYLPAVWERSSTGRALSSWDASKDCTSGGRGCRFKSYLSPCYFAAGHKGSGIQLPDLFVSKRTGGCWLSLVRL